MPEYCSHNETRGPEKSVTQVSTQKPFRPPSNRESDHRVQSTELWLDQQLCAMQSTCLTFCLMLRKDSSAKENNSAERARSPVAFDLHWANHWLLFWILWVSRVVRHVECWPIKRIYLNNVSRNGGSFTSNCPSHASAWGFLVECTRICRGWERLGGGGVNCLGSGWYRMAEAWQSTHSLGTSALVARKYTSIFYRSLGRIPGLCFYVSTAPHSLLIKAVSYQREYTHTLSRGTAY